VIICPILGAKFFFQDHKFADIILQSLPTISRKKQKLVNQKIKNMTMDFLHDFFRKDEKRRKWISTRILFLCAFFMAFTTSKVSAQFTAAGIDGNPQEWTQANINSIPIHSFIHDAFGNGVVDSQFTEGSKDFLLAADLRWAVSQTKAKNDIANAAAYLLMVNCFLPETEHLITGMHKLLFGFISMALRRM
jgi:hypothetical protein